MAKPHPMHALRQHMNVVEEELKEVKNQQTQEFESRRKFEEKLLKEIKRIKDEIERLSSLKAQKNLVTDTLTHVNTEELKSTEGHRNCAEIEKWKEAHPSLLENNKTEALAVAAYEGNLSVVQLLLDQQVSPVSKLEQPRDEGHCVTPLHEAVRGKHVNILHAMCEGAGEYVKTSTILCYAVEKSSPEVCDLLIKSGADVNAVKRDGYTPLHFAAEKDNLYLCKMLIMNGADVNAKRNCGFTALHLAASNGNVILCELLIKSGADVNAAKSDGYTPLHFAAEKDNAYLCKMLIKNGADVNAKRNCGVTALHTAASNRNLILCEALIESGANVNAQTNFGDIPPHWAVSNTEFFKNNGYSALEIAIRNRDFNIVRLLVDSNVDLSIMTSLDINIMQLAFRYKDTNIMEYLEMKLRSQDY